MTGHTFSGMPCHSNYSLELKMIEFLVRRLFQSLVVLLCVSFIVVVSLRFIPGDPARLLAGEEASDASVEQIRQELGLHKPVLTQYVHYLSNLLHGDLGTSYYFRRPVAVELMTRFPKTLELAAAGIVLAGVFGISFGALCALNKGSIIDRVLTPVALVGVCLPSFWIGLMLMFWFAVKLRWFPTGGAESIRHLALPSLTLGIWGAGFITRLSRSSMIDVLHQDFILVAKAKGLSSHIIVLKHALKNALIPTVTVLGLQFGGFLGKAVFVETVFARAGVARLTVIAVNMRDYPLLQGSVLFLAVCFVVINLVVDVLYGFLDPRIRY